MLISGIADMPAAADFIIGDFNSNCHIIIFLAAGAPWTVAFLYIKRHSAGAV